MIGDPGNCSGLVNGANADQVGTATAPLNPQLGAPAANGGPTPTQAPLAGSPAISAGNATDCASAPVNNLDQRGDTRNASSRHTCDIGAYDTGGINPTPLSLGTATLSAGQVGAAYSTTLTASGGTKPYNWSLSAGSLPAGLALNAATGAIIGTPTAAGTSSFTVKVTDAASPTAASATRALSITIAPPTLAVSTGGLPAGRVGTAYSASLSATGGVPGYRWSLTAGSLPAGLSLAPSSQVSGTPTASGTFTLTVTVTDSALPIPGSASRTLSVSIAVTPGVYAANTAGNSLTEYGLSATGDSAPALTLSGPDTGLSSPENVILDASGRAYVANASAGTVTEYAPGATGDARPQLTITDIPLPRALTLDPAGDLFVASLAGSIYEYASGHTPPILTIGAQQSPRGLAFDAAGHLYVSEQAENSIREYSLSPGGAQLINTLTGPATDLSSPQGLVFDPTGHLTVANSGNGLVTIYAAGASADAAPVAALSAGLQVPVGVDRGSDLTVFIGDSGLNAIVEYPSGASTPGAIITGPDTGLNNPLSVAATPPLSILSTRLPAAVTGERYLVNLRAAEGTTPYRWTLARGLLPRGLRLSTAGAIIGTPREGRVGTYHFTAEVRDASHPRQTVSQKLVIDLRRAPRLLISRLTIFPRALTAASSGASVTASIHPPGTGATVSYRLSDAGAVRFTVQQRRLGRRQGSGQTERCAASTTRAPQRLRCMRTVILHGAFTLSDTQGTNRLHFSGRLGGRRLAPGPYTLVAAPRPNHGSGHEFSIAFRILPPRA